MSAATWRRAALTAWTRVNSRNAATAWWQHHKHCPGIIIIIIIIIVQSNAVVVVLSNSVHSSQTISWHQFSSYADLDALQMLQAGKS